MKISVKVKASAKQNKVDKINDNQFLVWVKQAPVKGKANEAVRRKLAGYFGLSKSCIQLVKGQTAKQKVFVITDD